jgi:hypothetical protein
MHATCYNQNNVRTKVLCCQWSCKASPNYGYVGVNTQHNLYIELYRNLATLVVVEEGAGVEDLGFRVDFKSEP